MSGLLFLLIGIGLIANAALGASTHAQLQAEGKTISADVLDTQVVRSTKRGSVTSTRYEVKYRFQPTGKAVVTSGWEEAPEEAVRTAALTKTIEIRYLASDPSVNLPSATLSAGSSSGVASVWPLMVGVGLASVGLAIFLLARKGQGGARSAAGGTVVSAPMR